MHETDRIKEILMISRNDKGGNPLLFAVMDQDLIIFESFPIFKHQNNRLSIRFKRVSFLRIQLLPIPIRYLLMCPWIECFFILY